MALQKSFDENLIFLAISVYKRMFYVYSKTKRWLTSRVHIHLFQGFLNLTRLVSWVKRSIWLEFRVNRFLIKKACNSNFFCLNFCTRSIFFPPSFSLFYLSLMWLYAAKHWNLYEKISRKPKAKTLSILTKLIHNSCSISDTLNVSRSIMLRNSSVYTNESIWK